MKLINLNENEKVVSLAKVRKASKEIDVDEAVEEIIEEDMEEKVEEDSEK